MAEEVSTDSPRVATSGRRYLRSREGCVTCKRRKVKCDEQRPRCSHCERLNMECRWRPRAQTQAQQRRLSSATTPAAAPTRSPGTDVSSAASVSHPPHAVDEVFDYASFMWDSGDFWQQTNPGFGHNVGLNSQMLITSPPLDFSDRQPPVALPHHPVTPNIEGQMERPVLSVDTESLLGFFRSAGTPPVLAEVESQKRWLAMRQTFLEMAQMSAMVRSAILAFSSLLLSRQNGPMAFSDTKHYQDAIDELSAYHYSSAVDHSSEREYLLAALFFLSYVDILENRLDGAYAHLKQAYTIFQDGNKGKFSAVEKKVLMWLRLLDGKAVSAGGDGIFLSKEDELALVEASPSSFDGGGDVADEQAMDDDVEDMLFQVLYQPGIIFFQKVQSFMARISKIDPWHRSRGTVEDETEVMNIGSVIAADLRTLYEQRPALMDYAVAGKLSQPHISEHLARALSRAFRTYLANYYASKIHLHRVAYKTFPISKEAAESLYQIRRLAKLIARDLDDGDAMPANMLWPLLMLAVEEQNSQERVWIREQILGMEKVVGNARITAQVIEEVQARQEAAKGRMDIRTVMHAVFNAEFAIV